MHFLECISMNHNHIILTLFKNYTSFSILDLFTQSNDIQKFKE